MKGEAMEAHELPVSCDTWERLVKANRQAVVDGWAKEGVFGTGIGTNYFRAGQPRLLYVGKSAGPQAALVGSAYDQAVSCQASRQWMIKRENPTSHFWQFIEQIDATRMRLAWTNVCKMNPCAGGNPSLSNWARISKVSITALIEELDYLKPEVMVFATSTAGDRPQKLFGAELQTVFSSLGFRPESMDFKDGWTRQYVSATGQRIIETKHSQGWNAVPRDRVVEFVRSMLHP